MNNSQTKAGASDHGAEENPELEAALRQHFLGDPPPKNLVEDVTNQIRKQNQIKVVVDQPDLKPLKTVFFQAMMVLFPVIAVLCFLAPNPPSYRPRSLRRPVVQQDIQGTPESWVSFDLLQRLGEAGHIDFELGLGESGGYVYQAYWDGEDPHSWWVIAAPESNSDGDARFYMVNQSGEIRYEEGKIPSFSSPILGER